MNPRILIVEDNAAYSEVLKIMLLNIGFNQIEQAFNFQSSLEIAKTFKPEIALLDIELGEQKDGIELANQLNQQSPIPIVFITGNYNIETYDRARMAGPFSFINKDISQLKLKQAIELSILKHNPSSPQFDRQHIEISKPVGDDWYVKIGDYLRRIRLSEIDWIEVDGRNSYIVTKDKKYPINITLRELTEKLKGDNFQRIHRNYLINIDKIQFINLKQNEVVINEHKLPIGRSFRNSFMDNIQKIL